MDCHSLYSDLSLSYIVHVDIPTYVYIHDMIHPYFAEEGSTLVGMERSAASWPSSPLKKRNPKPRSHGHRAWGSTRYEVYSTRYSTLYSTSPSLLLIGAPPPWEG